MQSQRLVNDNAAGLPGVLDGPVILRDAHASAPQPGEFQFMHAEQTVDQFDLGRPLSIFEFLAVAAPTFGRSKSGFEVAGAELGCEADPGGGTVVCVAANSEKGGVARTGAGIVIGTFDLVVGVALEFDQPCQCLAGRGPDAGQEIGIGRNQVLAPGAQDDAGLSVDGDLLIGFRAEADGAILVKTDTVVGDFAQVAFQRGEESRHALRVVPDVGTGAGAAADAFPGPEAARRIVFAREDLTGRGLQGVGRENRAVEEPLREGGI